ncbi:reverse transcriptase domain-containing protein [Tanacetum coccineum]
MSAMLSSNATFSMEMFPFGHCPKGNGDVSLVCSVRENNNNNNNNNKTNEDRDDDLENIKTDDVEQALAAKEKEVRCHDPGVDEVSESTRTYPLSAEMCKAMLDKKLQGGKPDENCYKMLKMMEKQAEYLSVEMVFSQPWIMPPFLVDQWNGLLRDVMAKLLKVFKVKIKKFWNEKLDVHRKSVRGGIVGINSQLLEIAQPITKLLEKDTPFKLEEECQKAFDSLKEKLTCAPVIVSPNWNLLFELMCDAIDFAVGAILCQKMISSLAGRKRMVSVTRVRTNLDNQAYENSFVYTRKERNVWHEENSYAVSFYGYGCVRGSLSPFSGTLGIALIIIFERAVDDEAITFNVGQTLRYSCNNAKSVIENDVIDVSCEEYAQEVLRFLDCSTSRNPTPSLDHILSTSFPSLTPFKGGDIILKEIEACLTNDSIPPGIDDADFDPEGDLLLLKEGFTINDPSSLFPPNESF